MVILRRISVAALLVALVAAFSVPTDAHAQQQDVGQKNYGNLIAALNNVNAQIRALENVDIQNVQLVNVEDVRDNLNNNRVQVLNNALRDADIDALQNFLNDNEILNDALNQNNVNVSDVVAVQVLSGGDVTVFYQE